jgi:hypothetical protein
VLDVGLRDAVEVDVRLAGLGIDEVSNPHAWILERKSADG